MWCKNQFIRTKTPHSEAQFGVPFYCNIEIELCEQCVCLESQEMWCHFASVTCKTADIITLHYYFFAINCHFDFSSNTQCCYQTW